MSAAWAAHVTVAAVVEREGRFLLVEEHTDAGLRLNQPAGHLEAGETLVQAVVRETLEETAYRFSPEHLVGIYQWQNPAGNATFLRFAFCGSLVGEPQDRPLDDGIVRRVWMAPDELAAEHARHRSPLVRRCVEDYLRGNRFPLAMLTEAS
jgi:8-oxo-dGTP pyrophosphatase MutT (NUDIX family)